jgi:hypothetical protein
MTEAVETTTGTSSNTSTRKILQDVSIASATFCIIFLGVGLILTVATLPWILFQCFVSRWLWATAGEEQLAMTHFGISMLLIVMEGLHLRALWKSTRYLAVLRFVVFPIRKLLMPIVFFVVKLESIREETPTLFLDVRPLQRGISSSANAEDGNISDATTTTLGTPLLAEQEQRRNDEKALVRREKKSKQVQRRYKQMERAFHRDGIRHEWGWSETTLNLSQVVPVMWEHEKRICGEATDTGAAIHGGSPTSLDDTTQDKNKNPAEEFLKRFLVVSIVPNAVLDRYYSKPSRSIAGDDDDGGGVETLCSVQLSLQQGRVFHWFMYFSLNHVTLSGIWFHGIGTAMERARRIPSVDFCNGQVHKAQSKKNAGLLDVAEWTEHDKLSQLYPWSFTTTPAKGNVHVNLWRSTQQQQPQAQQQQREHPPITDAATEH